MAGTTPTKSTTARGKKSNPLAQPSTTSNRYGITHDTWQVVRVLMMFIFFSKENADSLQQSMLTRYIYETRASELPISERLHQMANTAASSKATDGQLRLDI